MTLHEIWKVVIEKRYFIVSMPIIVSACVGFYVFMLPNEYRATALIVPESTTSIDEGLSALAGQFGGLASMVGIDVPSAGNGSEYALAIMKSRSFLRDYIEKHNVRYMLFAIKEWDAELDRLVVKQSIYDSEKGIWRDDFFGNSQRPSEEDVVNELRRRLIFKTDIRTNITRVTLDYYSPVIAADWLNLMISELNLYMKNNDIKEAGRSIDYLTDQINNTSNIELKNMFYRLIESEHQKLMLAKTKIEYAFKVIDPAVPPDKKSKPKRLFLMAGAFIVSIFFIVLILLMHALSKSDQEESC